jgi:serralysin
MAIVIAGNIVIGGIAGIDTNDPDIGSLGYYDTALSKTGSYVSLQTGEWLDEFSGSFQYSSSGDLAGGTLTGWKETYQGRLVFEVSQTSVSVSTFLNWIDTGDNLSAAQGMLAGMDSIVGSGFSDRLFAHAGDDIVLAGDGDDLVVAGDGNDTVEGGAGADTINGNSGHDVIRETGGANYLRGDEGSDTITGGADFDDINGNMGDDSASGGAGNDWVVGGKDNDRLNGDTGDDIVYGNIGNDTCDGGVGNDLIRGGQDNDSLQGGPGADWISGDRGNDTMTGGSGADVFHSFGDAGIDRVTDFNLAEGDSVQLDAGTVYTVSQSGQDTVIDMTGGGQMTLVGITMGALTGTWIFGA